MALADAALAAELVPRERAPQPVSASAVNTRIPLASAHARVIVASPQTAPSRGEARASIRRLRHAAR